MRTSDDNKAFFKDKLLEDSINYQSFNHLYNKYFGDKLKKDDSDKSDDIVTFNDIINYSSKEKYDNSYKLIVGNDYTVNVLKPGIVVFIGEKDNLGNTVIVQGNDGVDIWYSNLVNFEYGMYDYVSKGDILGLNKDDYFYYCYCS